MHTGMHSSRPRTEGSQEHPCKDGDATKRTAGALTTGSVPESHDIESKTKTLSLETKTRAKALSCTTLANFSEATPCQVSRPTRLRPRAQPCVPGSRHIHYTQSEVYRLSLFAYLIALKNLFGLSFRICLMVSINADTKINHLVVSLPFWAGALSHFTSEIHH